MISLSLYYKTIKLPYLANPSSRIPRLVLRMRWRSWIPWWVNHHYNYVNPTFYPLREPILYMNLEGLVIVGFFHITLYTISKGPRKLTLFYMIAICNIPKQNHASHQPQILDILILVNKAHKKFLLLGVREKLC